MKLLLMILCLVFFLQGFSTVKAEDEAYFAGKTIRFVVGFRPGGGTDIQARYFALNWSKYIPGNPRVLVSNLTPNIASVNYLYKARPDGLTLYFTASGPVGNQYDKHAHFKAKDLRWVGGHAAREMIWLVRDTAPYKRLEECRTTKPEKPLLMTAREIENLSGKWLSAVTLARWFGCSLKVQAIGRGGTEDDLLMLERGETHTFLAGSVWYSLPQRRPGWLSKGFLTQFADLSHPETHVGPNEESKMVLPNVYELLTREQKEIWRAIHFPEVYIGKGIMAPPGTPENVLATLRKSYEAALADAKFSGGLEKLMGQPVTLIPGGRLEELTKEYMETFKPATKERVLKEAVDYIKQQ